jgi:GT2 family glycosyltransferase
LLLKGSNHKINLKFKVDKIAIVILNWNGVKMLETYLPIVLNCSRDEAVVYVADNASTDGSLELLRGKFPECRLIVLEKNWGFAEGYNKALAQIDAEYYLLLNSDVEVTPRWLTPLIAFMDAHADVAACQPKLLSIYNKVMFEYAGASGGYIDRFGYPFCRGRVFDTIEEDSGQYDQPADILWATGAALMIRSKDYWECGGLDGRFFAHNEEIDLCWRLRIRGRRICCLPESRVYHVGGGTLPKSNPMKTFLNFRNNLTMLYKCLPDSELRSVMRWRWLLDYLAAFEMLLLKRNVGEFKAVCRARRAFKSWRKEFAADRLLIQQSRSTANIKERRSFSLLWQYYVKGRRRYSDLPLD